MPSLTNILFVLGITLGLAGYSLCLTFTTSGESGEMCGSEGKKCLARQSVCDVNIGRCVCTKDRFGQGKGLLSCYRPCEYFTEIVNDPTVVTLNNNTVDFSLPCRFLVSHFTSRLKNKRKRNIGSCTFKIHAFQHKDKGKMYLAGYDVAIQIDYTRGNPYMASIRKMGKADNGTYHYTVLATDGQYLPDGPWGNDEIDYDDDRNGLKIKCTDDDDNNILLLTVKKCGVRFRLRGYDCILRRDQPIVPGFVLAISDAFSPLTFMSENEVMAMIPMDQSNGIDIGSSLVRLLDRRQSMVYRALVSGVTQNQPEPNPQCTEAVNFLNNCASDQELKEAFDNCLWMFKAPRFIRCFDDTVSGEKIMGLFNNCTSIYCGSTRGVATCENVIDAIDTAGCDKVEGYTVLDNFLEGTMCPDSLRRRRHHLEGR